MLECIQEMKHNIRTSYGLSDDTFDTRELEEKLQGILQRNGAAPTTWVLISTPLINLLQKKGYGGKFLSPIRKEITNLVRFAFVDDNDLILLNMIDASLGFDDIASKMQEAIELWENGLKVTGGDIVPEKSWLYPIEFNTDETKIKYLKVEEFEHNFQVKDYNDNQQELKKLMCLRGRKLLVFTLLLMGTMTKQ